MSAAVMATPQQQSPTISFMPREHGATAMLLIPFFSAAILAREWRWAEVAALVAAFCTFAAKDPLVVLARQRWVWKQRRPETEAAKSWLAGTAVVLGLCGIVLAASWPLWILATAGAGAAAFSALAVAVTVKNRQRSTIFQIVSAIAISSTSIAAGVSANGTIRPWCWWLWALCALQAIAGILVVHARLEARIAARKAKREEPTERGPAITACLVLVSASAIGGFARQPWIALAMLVVAAAYRYDLHRQKDADSLQMPLKRVGLQALTLAIAYALLIVVGLW